MHCINIICIAYFSNTTLKRLQIIKPLSSESSNLENAYDSELEFLTFNGQLSVQCKKVQHV